jgi:mRNA deadenylase 3'-5' endonuclease subunit Ccr4
MLDTGVALSSAYLACRGHEAPITSVSATFRGALDYIWLGAADDFSVSSVLELPYAEVSPHPEDIDLQPLPDKHFPSDHLAVGATLQLLSST